MEQKFKDFLNQYNGKFVEVVDPTNKNQCVDLARAWVNFLPIPAPVTAHLYAYQIYTNASADVLKVCDKIPNTPDAVPKAGDIVVWSASYNGGPGHVGIATGKGDTNTFECFEQNDPTGSNSHVKVYNYNAVLGWLRYKMPITNTPTQPMDTNWKQITDYAKGKFLVNEAKDVIKYIQDLDAYRKSESDEKDKKQKQINDLEKTIKDLTERLETEKSNHTAELAKKDADCQAKIDEIKAIPAKVEEKIVEIPRHAKSAWLDGLIQFLYSLER